MDHDRSGMPSSPAKSNDSRSSPSYASELEDTLPPLTSPTTSTLVSIRRLSALLAENEALLGIPSSASSSSAYPSPTKRRSSIATRLLRKRDLTDEPLSDLIERNKHFPIKMLDGLDETEYLELVPLLPTVTRFTLRELDMDEILLNPQLRHDLYFDPNLQFKPNTTPLKQSRAETYWTAIKEELENKETWRLPLILHEVKAILKELIPYSADFSAEVEANMDIAYFAQELEHGVFDPAVVVKWLCGVLKKNCAPARDGDVDAVVAAVENGDVGEGLKMLFGVLEVMKLDYANHQLTRIRPHVLERAVEFERTWFRTQLLHDRVSTTRIESWLKQTYTRLLQTPPTPSLTRVYTSALLHTLSTPIDDDTASETLPECFGMDISRLQTFRNDMQDIIIQSILLLLYKQLAGPRAAA
ncbi:hypothetical protein HDU99_007581, partial [Rhizoclosmatium hyalinum]